MVWVRRDEATSTHVWPAIPRLPGPPLRGLSGPALARIVGQPRMIQSGSSGRHLSVDDPVEGAAGLLLVLPRMMQSGASGFLPQDNVHVVLWPFSFVLPRMIQSRALHGLVSALQLHHGLIRVLASLHHHGIILFTPSLLLHSFVHLAAAPHHHSLVHLFTSLHHHGLVPP